MTVSQIIFGTKDLRGLRTIGRKPLTLLSYLLWNPYRLFP